MNFVREYDGSEYYFCWHCINCGYREYLKEVEPFNFVQDKPHELYQGNEKNIGKRIR